MDRSDPQRDEVHEAIQGTSIIDGAVLTGWVLIAEWMDPSDGSPALTVSYDATTTVWKAEGMLSYVQRHDLFRGEAAEENPDE